MTTDKLTFPAAAEKVLRQADGPMKVKAIAELAVPLTATAGKTPAATLGARLITDANRGGTFIKVAPGTFDVRELNPRGAAKRPTTRAAATRKTKTTKAAKAAAPAAAPADDAA